MKVQCTSCQATYNIAASKIPDEGGSATCKQCGAKILIRKPAPVVGQTAVCPKCGSPVSEDAADCTVCGVVMAKYKDPSTMEVETFEGEKRFRMSELNETGEDDAGGVVDGLPEEFSSGIGIKVQEARKTPQWLIGGLLILIALLAFFQFGGKKRWFGLFGGTVITMSEFQKVENGMSYSQVAQIIGEPGEETSSGRLEGVPGVPASVETISYQWINPDGSNMSAIFQNDRLITKTQYGLR